jgi:hypothetical protein
MYVITIFISIILLPFIVVLLRLSSNSKITQLNFEFIKDIYENCSEEYKTRITRLIDWHTAYNHPFLAERSKKIDRNGLENDMRFAIFMDLTAFVSVDGQLWAKKWYEMSEILGIPVDIERKCIEYIERGEEVDLIWGLDPLEKKEKIYLEYPNRGLIESYIVLDGRVLDKYKYVKTGTPNSSKYSFMYTRTTSSGQKDSYHYALREPIHMGKDGHKIYIVSHNPSSGTITHYYRPM